MKNKIFLCIIGIFVSCSTFAQAAFFTKNDHIQSWYIQLDNFSGWDKIANNTDFQDILKQNKTTFDQLNKSDFHFIDFDRNGIIDILFQGNINGSEYVLIWHNNRTDYSLVVQEKGHIYQSNLCQNEQALIFSVWQNACCGRNICVNTQYDCICTNNTSFFYTASKSLIYKGTFLPGKLISRPTAFHLDGIGYLRTQPYVDDSKKNGSNYAWLGNTLGMYAPNATGTIYAETQDEKGNFWYFVRMNNTSNTLIHSDRFVHQNEISDANQCFYYGWIKESEVVLDN